MDNQVGVSRSFEKARKAVTIVNICLNFVISIAAVFVVQSPVNLLLLLATSMGWILDIAVTHRKPSLIIAIIGTSLQFLAFFFFTILTTLFPGNTRGAFQGFIVNQNVFRPLGGCRIPYWFYAILVIAFLIMPFVAVLHTTAKGPKECEEPDVGDDTISRR